MKGYKVFNPDWTYRGFKYEVGKTYEYEERISVCGEGFHFCEKLVDCFNYHPFNLNNKVAEVEILGDYINDKGGSVTNKLKLVRELSWVEVLNKVNTGKCNTGVSNSGYYNSGDSNSGDYNSGNFNTGDCNSTDYSSGIFNSSTQKMYMFNKISNWTYDDWFKSEVRYIINSNFRLARWEYKDTMTDEEKELNPNYEITGGFLRTFSYKEAWQNLWNNITEEEKQLFYDLPNFDADIFKEITGIEICDNKSTDGQITSKYKDASSDLLDELITTKKELSIALGKLDRLENYIKMLTGEISV